MQFKTTASIRTFGGRLLKLTHPSPTTGCTMRVNVFLPPSIADEPEQQPAGDSAPAPAPPAARSVPVLFFLSGLTCTPDNCAEKGFLHPFAAAGSVAVVYPDTSPRTGTDPAGGAPARAAPVAGEDDAYDFGSAAGFYLDATAEPWRAAGYRMGSYVADELPALLFRHFPALDPARVSIMGHSMGGHGALTLYLRNPGKYRSVSALAPIANPSRCPWGQKAFAGYLGGDADSPPPSWADHDATELVRRWKKGDGENGSLRMLIDVGTSDQFYIGKQLLVENFVAAADAAGFGDGRDGDDEQADFRARFQPGYDHSYYFVSTFAADHIAHHARHLYRE